MNLGGAFTLGDVLQPVARALRLSAAADLQLAVRRIDLHHRELAALGPWPLLRRRLAVADAGGAMIEIEGAVGVAAVSRTSDGAPYWFCERWDVSAGDLGERLLWSLSMPAGDALDVGSVALDAWDWDTDAGVHVPSDETALAVDYWAQAASLLGEGGTYSEATALVLPETRALVVRSVLDLVGLMDRKEPDASPWRQEMDSAMGGLMARLPRAAAQVLRLPSGRMLTRGP